MRVPLRFARYKRAQHVHDVKASFQELQESRCGPPDPASHVGHVPLPSLASRLTEATFTNEEVMDMLEGLCAVVSGDVESELINSSHISVLMIQQVRALRRLAHDRGWAASLIIASLADS
jgi:leucine zipper transcription factor-like protein 1